MKKLIHAGLFLALGLTASVAGAQEIRWQAANQQGSQPSASAPTGFRPVTISKPTPLDGGPIVRAQAADDKTIKIEPLLNDKTAPKPMPKEQPFPPPPSPGPTLGGSDGCDDNCGDACGLGRHWWSKLRWGSGPLCCPTNDCCPDRFRCWASAEYLMWWQRAQNAVPLVTVSPAGTAPINSGVLGLSSTSVVFDHVSDPMRSGARFDVGWWCKHFCNVGIEFDYFFLGRQSDNATFSSDGNPQFSRPFFNALTQSQASEIVSNNNVSGSVSVHNYSQLWGAGVNLRYKWLCNPCGFIDVLVGYRHLNLSEGLDITENLQTFNPLTGTAAGAFLVQDSFRTRNQFNGVLVGLDGEWRFCNRWSLGGSAKIAFGSTHQIVDIGGSTAFTNFPAPFGGTFPGGLLALPGTNIGHYTRNRFAVAPELSLKLGYDITPHLRAFVGYDFLYLSSVVRPSDQIDFNVNPNFQPSAAGPGPGGGPRQPAVLFRGTEYWAQGMNFGLLYRY
jgi:Putative beta barrel porin-7 (BBP7)